MWADRHTGAYEACTGSGWWNVALSGLSADAVASVVFGATPWVLFSSSSGFEAHRDCCMIMDEKLCQERGVCAVVNDAGGSGGRTHVVCELALRRIGQGVYRHRSFSHPRATITQVVRCFTFHPRLKRPRHTIVGASEPKTGFIILHIGLNLSLDSVQRTWP